MMPRTDFQAGEREPVFKLHVPIIVEFDPEMNGDWFPWSGILNGEKKGVYEDRKSADGPERYRDAHKHIINLFRKEGAQNITWAVHVFPPVEKSEGNDLHKKWNDIKNYYPGDDYIDWIGLSVYGADEPNSEWRSFTDIMDKAYPVITEISADKPLAVFEFGIAEYPQLGNKTKWIKNALESVEAGRYPRIKAISYWDEV
jgi:beta-mannanase